MTRFQEAIGLGLVLGVIHGLTTPAWSVPVVPNFTQGSSMTNSTQRPHKRLQRPSIRWTTLQDINIHLQEVV